MLPTAHPSQISDATILTHAGASGIRSFQSRFPLPTTLAEPEVFVEVVDAGGVSVHACGLAAEHRSGRIVTGSAAELTGVPLARSYFELLERAAVIDFTLSAESRVPSPSGCQRYAMSNGVALASDAGTARARAFAELFERDRVLRSFYGETLPERLRLATESYLPEALSEHYELSAYRFPAPAGCDSSSAVDLEVAAVFGFPRRDELPLLFGFGAREELRDAVLSAARESLQQLAFGWDEPVPSSAPQPSATPEFHLEYFAYPGHHGLLRAWLSGAHHGRGPALPSSRGEACFIDLTPSSVRDRLWVVKCEHPGALPLSFGEGHPSLPELPECMRVHPIA